MAVKYPLWPNGIYDFYYGPYFVPLLPSFLLLCTVILIVYLRRSSLRLPQGPPALPGIGHLHLLGTEPHRSLWELSKRYGPLMFLRFGSVPVIVASTPDMARLILQKHDQIFCYRSPSAVSTQILECKDMLFSQPGPYFKLIRQLSFSDLFANKRLESFRSFILNEIRHLLCDVADSSSKISVREKLYETGLSIISRMTVGKHVKDIISDSSTGPTHNLVDVIIEIIELLGVFNIGDYIPWVAWMDLQGCVRRSKLVSKKMKAMFGKLISERRNERRNRGSDIADIDFLDVLLTASSNQTEIAITDSHITAIFSNMFGGGIDTSTITVEWALAELLKHPQIMEKLQDELRVVIGSTRLVEESDVGNLPYLRAVVKETMRLHPVLPLLVPHTAKQQCQVNGYDIPSSTMAYVNVWAIGRDPTAWEKPLEFYPDRFLCSNIDLRGQHFELLPFGSGRRACPGLALGISNVHLMLGNLVHAFDWEAVEEIDLTEKFGIVCKLANPLVAKAELRVPRKLFEAER